MSKFKLIVITLGVLLSMVASTLSLPAMAQSPAAQAQTGVNEIGGSSAGNNGSLLPMIHTAIDVLLFLAGLLSVVMIIWGAIRYITSRGESADVTAAKNTITYAIVGLILAIVAYAIVNFIVSSFQPSPSPTPTAPEPTPTPGKSLTR